MKSYDLLLTEKVERDLGIMIDQFSRSVTNLTGRVRSFGLSINNSTPVVSAGDVAKDASDYDNALKQLSLCVEVQTVDLNQHYTQLLLITSGLQMAKQCIQQKIESVDWNERPDWMRSLGSVNAALKTASNLATSVVDKV